jgi:hypothetical protein
MAQALVAGIDEGEFCQAISPEITRDLHEMQEKAVKKRRQYLSKKGKD